MSAFTAGSPVTYACSPVGTSSSRTFCHLATARCILSALNTSTATDERPSFETNCDPLVA